MKTAKEMFEYLNYYLQEDNEMEIIYTNNDMGISVKFDKVMQGIKVNGYMVVDLIKAISKQCKELGWLSD